MKMSDYYRQQMEDAIALAERYERCPEDQQKAAGARDARRDEQFYRNLMEQAIAEELHEEINNTEKENTNMKIEFTTIGGTHFESNESQTYFYATWTDGQGNRKTRRIKKAEFFSAQRENEIERKAIAEAKEQELDTAAENPEVTLEQFEQMIAETEESNTTEQIEEIAKEMAPKAKKRTNKYVSKKAAWGKIIDGVDVTLTEKQVDFIHHLPDTCFWENGLDSCIWTDVLCDEIGGQFAGKPMTVGAMISTLCEKGLGVRAKNRVNKRMCTSFQLTDLGKLVAAELGLN